MLIANPALQTTPQNLSAPSPWGGGPPPPPAGALNKAQIQGDVLIGLQKNFETFLFFTITAVDKFKIALRQIAPMITSTDTVAAREFQLRDLKAHGQPITLSLVGLNVAFTSKGIGQLVHGANLGDQPFAAGAAARAAAVNDAVDTHGAPTGWISAFTNNSIDGVFLITGGTKASVDAERAHIVQILGASAKIAYEETGSARPGAARGHEHFGWLDGVSQPGITGITTTPFPGQRMLDPGLFVFGYGGTQHPPLPWMKDGSFMVFRRLQQLVPEFDEFLETAAAALGTDPVLLGARMVGRWKSGAPMATTPMQDDPAVGIDPLQNNAFDFDDDQQQRRCPFGAHIRKTNPRADFDPQEGSVDPHRINRAGIPFGPEVTDAERASNKTSQQRGLMFVCYQTSIANQFEFVQSAWANSPSFIFGKNHPGTPPTPVTPGVDPIIGQLANKSQARTMDEPLANYPQGSVRSTLQMPNQWVNPTAAAYFFTPSIAAITTVLAA